MFLKNIRTFIKKLNIMIASKKVIFVTFGI